MRRTAVKPARPQAVHLALLLASHTKGRFEHVLCGSAAQTAARDARSNTVEVLDPYLHTRTHAAEILSGDSQHNSAWIVTGPVYLHGEKVCLQRKTESLW